MHAGLVDETEELPVTPIAPAPEIDDSEIAPLVVGEQVKTLYRQSVPVLMANFVNALIVSALLWGSIDRRVLVGWCGAMLSMCVGRMLLRRWYWAREPGPEDSRRWASFFVAGSACAGVMWGFCGFVLFVPGSLSFQLLVAFVIGGMGAGAAGALACYLPAFFAYFVLSVAPLIARLFLEGGDVHMGMGAMVTLYALGLVLVARNVNRSMLDAFALRFHNAALLEHVSHAHGWLEHAKRSLESRVTERTAELEQRTRRERALAEIGRRALGIQSLPEMLRSTTEHVAETLGVSHACVLQLQLDPKMVRLCAGVGWKKEHSGRSFELTDWDSRAVSTLASSDPVLVEDLDAHADDTSYGVLRDHDIRSGLSVAMICGDGPFGVLGVYSKQPRRFTGDEAIFLRVAASLLSNAVERSQAEAALRKSEQNFAALVLGSPDVILTVTTEGIVESSNPATKRLLGYTPGELTGRSLSDVDLFTSDGKLVIDRELSALVSGEERPPLELSMRRRDGKLIDVEVNQRLLQRDDGSMFVQAIIRDASERKRAEKVRAELELQLRQAQRVESVGRFAGGVAHDFNNLLTVILSNLSIVESDDLVQGDTRELVGEVSQAAVRAASLTKQLLAFSRKQVLEPRVLDVNAVVSGVEAMLQRLLGETIHLEIRLGKTSTTVRADPTQLEQVIVNLVANGRDAMPNGGTVTLETSRVYLDDGAIRRLAAKIGAGRYVAISVSDCGVGMDEQTRLQVFEPFFTTKGPKKGTGLGLATTHGIVVQSGGAIVVSSKLGEGSRFTVYLPYTSAEPAPRRPSSVTNLSAVGNRTVLVVEDERLVRQAARRVLQRAGFDVLVAKNGAEAIEIASNESAAIDLVISDVVMPKMSGPTLARRLEGLRPNIKILFVSGYTGDELSQSGSVDEGVNFLQKPFKPDALIGKVKEVLDRS